jgi:Transcription factor WhiB
VIISAAVVQKKLFFPVARTGPVHDAQVAAAKAVCARCSVAAACLTEALDRIPDGIAGGLTAVERRALRRRHRRAVSAAERPPMAAERAGTAEAGGQAA